MMLWLLLCAPVWSAERDAVVAKLDGVAVVTEGELADWQAAQACYGEGALTSRNAGLMRLLEAAIAEKALKDTGASKFTQAEVEAEAARIDRETRAPDILACIKNGLKGERYLKAFVKPTLVESKLRSYLMQDVGVQAGSRKKVEDAIRKARQGSLQKAAKQYGLVYSSMTYSLEATTGSALPWSPYEKEFIEQHLKKLKAGELGKAAIESDYDFRAVRLLKTDGKKWFFESAYALKLDQVEWLKGMPKMKLEILDEGLRGWVKGIKGNPRLVATEVQ
ncbi:MAG TPA: hypothetical protein DCM05_10635 [Elusimicrobia bacterium]|nr:hypothetical protein [Elusimicrobiota bacterium]